MGQEIGGPAFAPGDFEAFRGRLAAETRLLREMIGARRFDERSFTAGFELEAWLMDHSGYPAADNERFLERAANPMVVSELSRFNVELNCTPRALRGDALRRMEADLAATWSHCQRVAHALGDVLVAIGILPTIREEDLCLANMSPMNRYFALNQQVLAARGGRPIRLDIRGRERLALAHPDVMLEAATTSFQVHLQAPASQSARYHNAAVLLSAPMVAVSANSPFLFQASLWEETRIPLFEQAVDTSDPARPEDCRVTFGEDWVREGLHEVFEDNLQRFAPLLPVVSDAPPEQLRHLRLHNGTIWRWNRPLVGFDEAGTPHLRIEHRVMPAGPSIVDMIANAALFYGCARVLATLPTPPEQLLDFGAVREDFYQAARDGLQARIRWLDGRAHSMRSLLEDELLPMARTGLALLGIDEADADRYLDVIAARVRTGQNGAAWQRAHLEAHGRDFMTLVANYLEHQRSAMPVHEWTI
ncbi:MAG TPA: hypothetical protein VN324_14460 [Quisquiliibacterium sp.]|nr:hypothetical protein [Quisquiliibacterium sp.]